jgi:hypothetical protein
MAVESPYIALRCPECGVVIVQDCDLPTYNLGSETGSDAAGTEESEISCPQCEATFAVAITAWQLNYWEVECSGVRVLLHTPPSFEDEDQFEMYLDDVDLDDPYHVFLRSSSGLDALAKAVFSSERVAFGGATCPRDPTTVLRPRPVDHVHPNWR